MSAGEFELPMRTELGGPWRLVPGRNVVAADVGTATVLLESSTGTYFSVEGVGVDVWRALDERPTFSELLTKLGQAFAVGPDALDRDLRAFLTEMAGNGLVVFERAAEVRTPFLEKCHES